MSYYGSTAAAAASVAGGSSSASEDVPFELLHLELAAAAIKSKDKDAGTSKLELLGFNAGYRLIERLTRESPKFKDELDLMKFVCKDFWVSIFKKQVDNLRTNHQGVYVLQDNQFRFLAKVSQGKQYLEFAPFLVAFTCGLLRGSLANLGVASVVTAEVASMPSVKFQVEVQRA